MRNSSRWLLGLALGSLGVFAHAGSNSLLVGEHKLTEASLAKALAGLGSVLGKDAKGYYRVSPTGAATLAQVRTALKNAGVDLIFDGTADTIDRSNYFSVKTHREYLSGANLIETGKAKKNDFYQALEWYLSVRTDPATGELSHDEYIKAANHRDAMPAARMDMIDPAVKGSNAPVGSWGTVGPRALAFPYQQYYGGAPLSGRKNAVHESTHNGKSYVASAGGGIWGSVDNGITFSPKSNSWKFLHTTCVTTDWNNGDVVYAGTGDYYGFFNKQTFGIMKSTDAGATWTNVGASSFGDSVVTRIMVDPGNSNTVVALTADGPTADIWRSTDAGATWTATAAANSNWEDIERSASGITMGACGASGKKLAWSQDGGATWTNVNNVPAAAGGSLWDIAISPNVFDRWYLICSNRKVYRIENALSTTPSWTDITASHDAGTSDPGYNWSQSTYDIYVECGDAGATDVVYTGLITVEASDDNGVSWADIARSFEANSKMHNDQHCFEVDPDNGLWGIAGGDGGAWGVVYNPATNSASFTSLNDDIIDQQFYTGAVHPTNTSFVMGGTQDNATPASRGNGAAWSNLFAGDGTGVGFDLNNPAKHYTGAQGGSVYRYDTDLDTSATNISPGGSNLFVSPLICAGSYAVHGGNSNIKLNLNGTSGWTLRPTGGGSIRHLEKSKHTNDRIYTGATNGDMYRHIISTNTTTKIDGTTLPNASIGGFTESYFSTDFLTVGLQRVGVADVAYKSSNVNTATPVWTNMSGAGATALPMMPVNDMERDPWNAAVYYAATDVGVFMSPDTGSRWYNMNAMGLPNVHVNELWIYDNGATKYLYAFTFGRGVWRIPIGNRFINTFTLNKTAVYGGETVVANVGLNGSASQACYVSVTDDSVNVSTPGVSGVLIPQGSTARSFNVYTTNPTSTQNATLTARMYQSEAAGSRTATLAVHPIPNFLYTSSVDNVYGGSAFIGTVNLGAAAPITTTVTFSDTTTSITSPSATSIAAGASSKAVVLTTFSVASTVNATINARISTLTRSDTVAVQPKPVLSTVSMNPNPVRGGNSTTGTVTLVSAGLAGNISVAISDTSSTVITPSTITIIGGATTGTFNATTSVVGRSINVTVSAAYNGITRTTVLRVDP
ncbi:MAG: hypothetical protein ABL949_15210 [Fimbriimonadaceae bacterium]